MKVARLSPDPSRDDGGTEERNVLAREYLDSASVRQRATMTILSSPIDYISSTPPVTRGFVAATILSTLLFYTVSWNAGQDLSAYFVLVPGSSLFYPWTFFTAGLVEASLLEVRWLSWNCYHAAFQTDYAAYFDASIRPTVAAVF